MNLDDRIGRDAERWRTDDQAPSFDDALERAAVRSRRTVLAPLLVAAVVVLIALVIAALVAFPRHTTPSGEKTGGLIYRSTVPSASLVLTSPAPNLPPARTLPDGTRVRYRAVPDVPVAAGVVDPAAPRTLRLMVADNGGPECSVADVSVTSVRESEDAVQVQLGGTRMIETSSNGNVITFGCTPAHYYAVDVLLHEALASRTVTVGAKAAPLSVLRTDELTDPSYLPAGYERRGNFTSGLLQSDLMIQHAYQDGSHGKLVLIALHITASGYGAEPPAHGSIDVDGNHASFDADGGGCLSWRVRAGVWASVCDQGQLSDNQIIRIARSLK